MADQKLSFPCTTPKTEIPAKPGSAKRAAIYTRVSTGEQNPETQLYDLHELSKQRGYEIVLKSPNHVEEDKLGRIPVQTPGFSPTPQERSN
jgi:resolvase-like protein